jgi:diacylglycerol kinase (ATP)
LKTTTLIYNPIAGRQPERREKEIREAAAVLGRAGIAVQLAATTGTGVACQLAAAAAQQGDDMVVVCGGDGTINEAVNGLAFSKTRLAILPGGTANIIAKELRLPHSLVRAARELPQWRPRLVPLGVATWPLNTSATSGESETTEMLWGWTRGLCSACPDPRPSAADSRLPREAQHRYFLSVGGIGFDAHIVDQLKHDFKMFLGVAAYGIEALRQVTRYGFPPFICHGDGRQVQAAFAAIQRTSRYAGWFRMAPRADFFEPRLNACLFQSRRWPRYLVYVAALAARRHLQLADVTMVETERVECFPVEPEARIRFELDGELVGALPAAFEVTRDALTLLTPN